MTIIEFLNARYDEEEALARAATEGPWTAEEHHTPAKRLKKQVTLDDTPPTTFCAAEVHPVAELEGNGDGGTATAADAHHIALHDPTRVLREIAAKRAIIREHPVGSGWDGESSERPVCVTCADLTQDGDRDGDPYPCRTLRLLLLPYVEHPDHEQEWAL